MPQESPTDVTARLRVFGSPETPARARVVPRSVSWRLLRAGGLAAAGVVAAPVVALIPPHAAWAMGSVVTGLVLAARRWAERWTVLALEGRCPRCGEPMILHRPTRLRSAWSVGCDACHHAAVVEVDLPSSPR